jgi:multiple sugar transport system permease protein
VSAAAEATPRLARPRARARFTDSAALLPALVAGALVFIIAFIGYPVAYNLAMSFQEVNLGNLRDFARPFVGLENYRALVADPLFWPVLRNTLVFVTANVVLQVLLGLGLALFFLQDFPGAAWMRGMILAGWILPPLVIAAIFKWLFASNGGLVNEALMGAGLVAQPVNFLSDTATAMATVTFTNIWFGTPFAMILLSAGLANLPRDVHEAAQIDGAGPWTRFTRITLPLLMPTLLAVTCLSTIYTLRAFDVIWGMTGGGPANTTNVLPVWSFQLSFQQFNFAQGAVIATMMFALVIVVALLYIRSLRAETRA